MTSRMLRSFFLSLLLGIAILPQAEAAARVLDEKARRAMALMITKNVRVSVFQYRKDADVYVMRIEAEPDVGPNTTTLEWLIQAVDNGSMDRKMLKRNPTRILGELYRLKRDLWLLSDEEIEARRKNRKK